MCTPHHQLHSPHNTMNRSRYRHLAVGVVIGIVITLTWLRSFHRPISWEQETRHPSRPAIGLPCARLPGANDTLVVMRTGATEFQDKVPVHLSTTMRCYPHHMIVADFDEMYQGERIVDVLASVSPEIKEAHPDFSLYRRLRVEGRAALRTTELTGSDSSVSANTGKAENPGWKLDKWKFLPMMNLTLHRHPNMKWYLFVEPDAFVFWATMLQYLGELDHTRPYYLGGQINIGDITFAHGGGGFAVSHEALRRVVEHYIMHKKYWEDFTDGHWAGDCVLGKAFKDAGAPLTYAWPIFQSEDIGVMPYGRVDNGRRLWCHPTVSYHHLHRDVIDDMWNFEQKWLSRRDKVRRLSLVLTVLKSLTNSDMAGVCTISQTQRRLRTVRSTSHARTKR